MSTQISLLVTPFFVLAISFTATFANDDEDYITLSHKTQRNDSDAHPPSFPRLPVEAIYQFGDSLSDTSNLIRVDPTNNCGEWPYGETSFDNPTGRCSDGFLMIDFFAKFWNLPLIDAYMDKQGNFKNGVNFAVSGATALNVSTLEDKYNVSSPTTNLSLYVQLDWFKSHLNFLYPNVSERRSALAKAVVFMGEIGGNDYNFGFWGGKTLPHVYTMVPHVIQAIKNATEEIIHLGATQITIPGNFPIGCVPGYLTLFKTNDSNKYDDLKCLKEYNDHAKFHNDKLKKTILQLQKDHPKVAIVFMDYYKAFKELLQHSTSFGFNESVVQKACCGPIDAEFNFEMNVYCGSNGVPVCENPKKHISWDGVHLTQEAYYRISKQLMQSMNGGATSLRTLTNWRYIVIYLVLILLF